mgnify:CR=1 FL=1|tara:strand:- start:42 stop:608 length:567 start_codon:yes stop_codon:yes gene_type:complete
MKEDLRHYVKHSKGFIPSELCSKLVDEMSAISFQQHKFYDTKKKTYKTRSGSQELSVSWDRTPSREELQEKLWKAIEEYLLHYDMPWFGNWQGYTSVRFNKYSKDTKMALHCDHIHTMFDGKRKGIPILSIVGVLNDDYEGGEFVMFDDYNIDFRIGDVLIFPSIFLYPHRVEAIKEGTRYSYISWVW